MTSMRILLVGLLFCAGCTMRMEIVTVPDPATVQWQKDVAAWQAQASDRINKHDAELRDLQQRVGQWDATKEGDI